MKRYPLRAVSKDRYRATAAERRKYGGSTVTEFYITRTDTDETEVFTGYGKTPGERKTHALLQARKRWWPEAFESSPAELRQQLNEEITYFRRSWGSARAQSARRIGNVLREHPVLQDQVPNDVLDEVFPRGPTPNARSRHFVWLLRKGSSEPLESEGPYGPYEFDAARTFARVGATHGEHDRVVTLGSDPTTFEVLRRYQARTGKTLVRA